MAEQIPGGQLPHAPETGLAADETDKPSSVPVYLVTIDTPQGRAELEVPTLLGPAAAERRAWMTAVQLRWGDVDEITVVSTELIAEELPMRVTLARFIEAPVCANCCDYVDFPGCKLIGRQRGWVHFSTGELRCPGQEDDDTDDRGEPLTDSGWYVIGFDPSGLPACGTVRR